MDRYWYSFGLILSLLTLSFAGHSTTDTSTINKIIRAENADAKIKTISVINTPSESLPTVFMVKGADNRIGSWPFAGSYTKTQMNALLAGKESTISSGTGDKFLFRDKTWQVIAWSIITGKPNSILGYGIIDAYTMTQVNNLLNNKLDIHAPADSIKLYNFGGTDMNSYPPGTYAFRYFATDANAPTGGTGLGIQLQFGTSRVQVCFPYTGSGFQERYLYSGTWWPWSYAWHSGNFDTSNYYPKTALNSGYVVPLKPLSIDLGTKTHIYQSYSTNYHDLVLKSDDAGVWCSGYTSSSLMANAFNNRNTGTYTRMIDGRKSYRFYIDSDGLLQYGVDNNATGVPSFTYYNIYHSGNTHGNTHATGGGDALTCFNIDAMPHWQSDITVADTGWYKIARFPGSSHRGWLDIDLFITGGSYYPRRLNMKVHNTNSISDVDYFSYENGSTSYWNQARIVYDANGISGATDKYLEVHFTHSITASFISIVNNTWEGYGIVPYTGALPSDNNTSYTVLRTYALYPGVYTSYGKAFLDGDSVWNSGNFNPDSKVNASDFNAVWTDYHLSTVSGWLSYDTLDIDYCKKGSSVMVRFYISGNESIGSLSSFTLPYATTQRVVSYARVVDAFSVLTTPGMIIMNIGSGTVNVYKDWSGTSWTSQGRRVVEGTFTYLTSES